MTLTQLKTIEISNLSVEFGMTRALNDVTVSAVPGEIIGLVGHNGAGKTTLFNVISGVVTATEGEFKISGELVDSHLTPKDANQLGVVTIHQEPALALNLTVFDNIRLSQSHRGSRAELRALARETLDSVGGESIELDRLVDHLSLAERQVVNLARGMFGSEMKLLLLDEPTASLGESDTKALHALIRTLASQGVTVVYVSHRLPDIFDVCSRITVLRGGEVVEDGPVEEFTPERLVEALAPGLAHEEFVAGTAQDPVITVRDPYALEFRAGEVVGLYGMAAGAHFDLIQNLVGLRSDIRFDFLGTPHTTFTSPSQAIHQSVFYVPGDRDREGLIGELDGGFNIMLPWLGKGKGRGWMVRPSIFSRNYSEAETKLNIRGPGQTAPISLFSGGNRQKHLLARWMYPEQPRVLVLTQPTQGVDVGAKVDIVRSVRELAAKGTCVIVASSESDEIASMAERAYVIHGNASEPVPRTERFDADLLKTLLELGRAAGPARPASEGR